MLPDAWKKQGLFFSESRHLTYGLVQKKGGPCGVLASIQALVLRYLRYSGGNLSSSMNLRPTSQDQKIALVLAIAEMLVKALYHDYVVIALPSGKGNHLYRTSNYKPDGVSDDLELIKLELKSDETSQGDQIGSVAAWLLPHLHHFTEENGSGCLFVLFSVMFTRGLRSVKLDMDEGFAGEVRTLLDPHFYMSQEGVNLLITGRAVSNVFNGERRMEDNVSGTNVRKF